MKHNSFRNKSKLASLSLFWITLLMKSTFVLAIETTPANESISVSSSESQSSSTYELGQVRESLTLPRLKPSISIWSYQDRGSGFSSISNHSELALDYVFNRDQLKLGYVQILEGSLGEKGDINLGDGFVRISKSEIPFFARTKLVLEGRLYVPISKSSQESESLPTRLDAILSKDLGQGWELEFLASPRVVYHGRHQVLSKDSADSKSSEGPKFVGNRYARYLQYCRIGKDVTTWLNIGHSFGSDHHWSYRDSDKSTDNSYNDFWTMETSVNITFNQSVGLYASVDQSRQMDEVKGSFVPYGRSKETTYNMIMSAAF